MILVVGRTGVTISRERLRAARERKGLNQRQLADQIGVHPSDISAYETGRSRPDPATLRRLADALQVDPLDLLQPGTPVTLQVLRFRAGLTQAETATAAGLTRSTYAAIERGDTRLGPGRAEPIARALTTADTVTTAEQVAAAVGQPARIEYVLPTHLVEHIERARKPGEDLLDTLTRLLEAGPDQ